MAERIAVISFAVYAVGRVLAALIAHVAWRRADRPAERELKRARDRNDRDVQTRPRLPKEHRKEDELALA